MHVLSSARHKMNDASMRRRSQMCRGVEAVANSNVFTKSYLTILHMQGNHDGNQSQSQINESVSGGEYEAN